MGETALDGRRIVLTRPSPGALADRLASLGAEVVHIPLIAIGEASDGGAALAEALAHIDEFDWLVVTSANGAGRAGAAARGSAIRLAAVGATTATILAERAGRSIDLVPNVPRSAGLLAEFPAGPSRVLLAQGNLAGDDLAEGLRGLGCDVTAVEAYSTVLRRLNEAELAQLSAADVVVLASGSAVDAWQQADQSPITGAVVTIGPKTAAVAASRGVRVAAVAATPSDDDVITAVVEASRRRADPM